MPKCQYAISSVFTILLLTLLQFNSIAQSDPYANFKIEIDHAIYKLRLINYYGNLTNITTAFVRDNSDRPLFYTVEGTIYEDGKHKFVSQNYSFDHKRLFHSSTHETEGEVFSFTLDWNESIVFSMKQDKYGGITYYDKNFNSISSKAFNYEYLLWHNKIEARAYVHAP